MVQKIIKVALIGDYVAEQNASITNFLLPMSRFFPAVIHKSLLRNPIGCLSRKPGWCKLPCWPTEKFLQDHMEVLLCTLIYNVIVHVYGRLPNYSSGFIVEIIKSYLLQDLQLWLFEDGHCLWLKISGFVIVHHTAVRHILHYSSFAICNGQTYFPQQFSSLHYAWRNTISCLHL